MTNLKKGWIKIWEGIKKHKKISIVLLCVATALVFLGIRFNTNKQQSQIQQKGTESYIRTVTLTRGSLDEKISSTGNVESTDVSTVTSNLDSTVKTVLVQVGDVVEKGDIIVTLDSTEILSQIEKAKDSLQENMDKAYSSYAEALDEQTSAENTVTSTNEILSTKSSILSSATNELNSVKSSIATFQSIYDSAFSAQEKAGLALNTAKTNLQDKENAYNIALASAKELSTNTELDDNSICQENESCVVAKDALEIANKDTTLAQGNYDAALVDTESAKTNLEDAKRRINYDTYLNAYNTAVNEYSQAELAHNNAETSLEKANNNVTSTYNSYIKSQTSDTLDSLNEQLEKCTLRAESSGTVTSLNATVGSKPNGTIATIQNINKLKVSISIEEYDVNSIKVGMNAIITSDATEKEMNGIVTQISPVAESEGMGSTSSTFSAEVEITDPDENLLIGMNAKVEIIVSSISNVFTVPYDAVGEDDEGNSVIYVQNASTRDFEAIIVTKGDENDYYIEISGSNLSEGMIVRASANEDEATEESEQTVMPGGFNMGDMGTPMTSDGNNRGSMSGGQRPAGGN